MWKKLLLATLFLAPTQSFCGISTDSLVIYLAKTQGHKLTKESTEKISSIESSQFKTQAWKEYAFKSLRPLPHLGKAKYYFEYSASVLNFPDSNAAIKRLDSLYVNMSEEDRLTKSRRRGLRIGSQVIYLRTHSTVFYPALDELHRSYLESWVTSHMTGLIRQRQDTLFMFCSGWVCSLYVFNKQGNLNSIEAATKATQIRRAWGTVWNAHSICGPQCNYDFFYDASSSRKSEVFHDAFAVDIARNRIALRDSDHVQIECILPCSTKVRKVIMGFDQTTRIPKGTFSESGLSMKFIREGLEKDTLIEF